MKETQILSTFGDWADTAAAHPHAHASDAPPDNGKAVAGDAREVSVWIWDTCHVGVVLRAVLFVQAITAVAALFEHPQQVGWLFTTALWTAGTLPATLIWLLLACSGRRVLARWPMGAQWTAAAVLGALSGLAGCGLLAWTGLGQWSPWAGSAAAGALVALVLFAALVWRAKAMMPAATQARLVELQSRIRPHFLFNTLNSAMALVRAEPRRVEALLEDLSELFRYALTDQGESVPLAREIQLARRYLDIEQVRFGPRLRVHWQIDPAADNALLPPLTLQPLVENAVKHGVEPNADGADLRISTARRGSVVVVKVSNSVGTDPGSAGHGIALANLRERLALLHDLRGQFRYGRVRDRFEVRLELPA